MLGLGLALDWMNVSHPPPNATHVPQASRGDNTGERPMWAERGGLDFEGRARWDAWTALRGTDPAKARLRFVKLFHEFVPAALYRDTRAAVLSALAPAGPSGLAEAPAGPVAVV